MDRAKRVIVMSHCILNQNSVVRPLARAKGAYNQIVQVVLDYNIGIVQLPCPEILYLGLTREPMTMEHYNTLDYNRLCQELLEPIISQLLMYRRAKYELLGVVGVEDSPSCDLTGNGIFMNHLLRLLSDNDLNLSTISVPTSYREDDTHAFIKHFKDWLARLI